MFTIKANERFNLAGDFTWRKITDQMKSDELMVSHGGYDNGDVNKDINCMFPIDRIHELAKEGFIKACAPVHAGFMGGGGNQEKFKHETGPAIAQMFKRGRRRCSDPYCWLRYLPPLCSTGAESD